MEEENKKLCGYCEMRERKDDSLFCSDDCEQAQKLLNTRRLKDLACGRKE